MIQSSASLFRLQSALWFVLSELRGGALRSRSSLELRFGVRGLTV